VTFVGDRGMIKSGQVEDLARVGVSPPLPLLPKPQIEALLQSGVLQMELFGVELCEVEHEGRRYVLRRNPLRAEQLKQLERYLTDHPRDKVATAEKAVRAKIVQLKVHNWLQVSREGAA